MYASHLPKKSAPTSLAGGGAPERGSAKSQRAPPLELGEATKGPDTLQNEKAEDLILIIPSFGNFHLPKSPCYIPSFFWGVSLALYFGACDVMVGYVHVGGLVSNPGWDHSESAKLRQLWMTQTVIKQ